MRYNLEKQKDSFREDLTKAFKKMDVNKCGYLTKVSAVT